MAMARIDASVPPRQPGGVGWMGRAPAAGNADFAPEWDDCFATGRFDAFAARHRTAAYRVALGILRQPEEAEEAVADAFAGAYRAYRAHRAAGEPLRQPPVPFLYAAVRHRAIDRYRAARRRPPQLPLPADADEHDPGLVTAADEGDDDRELLAAARACIAALPAPHREVCAAYYLEGLGLDEVAAATGLAYPRVRAVLKSAREQIGRLLAPRLLAEALAELAPADRALLDPYYAPTGGQKLPAAPASDAFAQARLRLVARLLRWDILFQRLDLDARQALAAYARHRDHARAADAVTAHRRQRHGEAATPCTPAESAALVARALAQLDRRLRARPA